jgi:hypothetical protein
MDKVGLKGRYIPDYTVPEAGFCTVYLEDVSILSMDEGGFKTQPEVSGEVQSSLYLYLWLASVLYTWRKYPSSVWTRWVSRLNQVFW